MKLSKKEIQTLEKEGYDLEFVSQIQPQGGIKFEENYMMAGDGYIGCLHVISYAEDIPPLWLLPLTNIENTISTFDISTANKHEMINEINRTMSELKDRAINERKSIDKDDAYYELMNLREFAQAITQKGEIVKLIHNRIFCYHLSFDELQKRMDEIRKELASLNHKTTIDLFRQKDEWMSLFTSYDKHEQIFGTRKGVPVPAENVGAGIPFHHQSLKDPRGIYLGQTSTGGAFLLDMFYSTPTRRSFNGFCLGKMGFGKSTLIKMLEEGLVARNCFIRGFDKARDYYNLVQEQNGKIIDLSGGEWRVNPLEVFATKTDIEGKIVDEYGSFIQHISKVSNMVRFMNPELKSIELTEFNSLLRDFYIEFGLLDKDFESNKDQIKITGLKPEQYPIFTDLEEYLKKVKYEKATAQRIRTLEVIQIIVGNMIKQYGFLFNGHSTVSDIDNEQILLFDIDGISQLDKEVFNCQLFTALTLMWNHALKNGRKMKALREKGLLKVSDVKYFMVLLDECHNVINANNIFAVEYVISFEREMRKFSAGILFATQSPAEVLPESASDYAVTMIKTVFELTQYKVFFSLDNSVMGRMREVLGDSLTDTQYTMLPDLKMGQAIVQTSSSESYVVTFDAEDEQIERFRGGQ